MAKEVPWLLPLSCSVIQINNIDFAVQTSLHFLFFKKKKFKFCFVCHQLTATLEKDPQGLEQVAWLLLCWVYEICCYWDRALAQGIPPVSQAKITNSNKPRDELHTCCWIWLPVHSWWEPTIFLVASQF